MVEDLGFGIRKLWAGSLVLPLASLAKTVGVSSYLFEPQFPSDEYLAHRVVLGMKSGNVSKMFSAASVW